VRVKFIVNSNNDVTISSEDQPETYIAVNSHPEGLEILVSCPDNQVINNPELPEPEA